EALSYYGGFLEANYRLSTNLLALLRADYVWMPRFDDTRQGGTTAVRRELWEITAGPQWSLLENLKLLAEVTYGEDHETLSNRVTRTWAGTVRVVTAFWPFTPPALESFRA